MKKSTWKPFKIENIIQTLSKLNNTVRFGINLSIYNRSAKKNCIGCLTVRFLLSEFKKKSNKLTRQVFFFFFLHVLSQKKHLIIISDIDFTFICHIKA